MKVRYNPLARKTCIDLLIKRVNEGIQAGNLRKVRLQHRQALPITPPVSRRNLARAVAIARHPGPFIDFKKGDLDDLLAGAGYSAE